MRSRFDKDFSTSELGRLLMRNSTFQYRNFRQVLLRSFYTFGDSCCYFTCLTKAPTNDTFFITYYNDSRKSKCSTTLCDLGYTVDSNQSVLQLYIV